MAQRLSAVGTWEWNITSGSVFWSEEVLAVWGLEPKGFRGTYDEVSERVHPEDIERWRENVRACVEDGQEHNIEFRVVWPDGTVHWIAAIGNAERNRHGEAIRMVGVIMDITDRKQAEMERETLIAKLESQNAELERFTYTVSHDLRSPLITIQGFVGLLGEELEQAGVDFAGQHLVRIEDAANKMAGLLKDLLELSRIGRVVNPPEDIELGELADEVLELLHGRLEEHDVRVTISPEMPTVRGDRVRVREVLQNLIDNATKYMGDTSQPRIDIGASQDGHEVVCFVRDNGMGIDPRYQHQVFELFNQLDPTMEGSGIGLAIVKRIVEVNGGRIWIESDGVGHGTAFHFTLPSSSVPP